MPEALDSALEQEWNAMLDRCKEEALPEPRPDVSLGLMLRGMVRERKASEWYSTVEAEVARSAAALGDADSARASVAFDGECAASAHQCEKCSRCFLSLDKLDRHRLCCLDEAAASQVLVRSSKAFSGFEGVVSSQDSGRTDKWEAYFIQSVSYGPRSRAWAINPPAFNPPSLDLHPSSLHHPASTFTHFLP